MQSPFCFNRIKNGYTNLPCHWKPKLSVELKKKCVLFIAPKVIFYHKYNLSCSWKEKLWHKGSILCYCSFCKFSLNKWLKTNEFHIFSGWKEVWVTISDIGRSTNCILSKRVRRRLCYNLVHFKAQYLMAFIYT